MRGIWVNKKIQPDNSVQELLRTGRHYQSHKIPEVETPPGDGNARLIQGEEDNEKK